MYGPLRKLHKIIAETEYDIFETRRLRGELDKIEDADASNTNTKPEIRDHLRRLLRLSEHVDTFIKIAAGEEIDEIRAIKKIRVSSVNIDAIFKAGEQETVYEIPQDADEVDKYHVIEDDEFIYIYRDDFVRVTLERKKYMLV